MLKLRLFRNAIIGSLVFIGVVEILPPQEAEAYWVTDPSATGWYTDNNCVVGKITKFYKGEAPLEADDIGIEVVDKWGYKTYLKRDSNEGENGSERELVEQLTLLAMELGMTVSVSTSNYSCVITERLSDGNIWIKRWASIRIDSPDFKNNN